MLIMTQHYQRKYNVTKHKQDLHLSIFGVEYTNYINECSQSVENYYIDSTLGNITFGFIYDKVQVSFFIKNFYIRIRNKPSSATRALSQLLQWWDQMTDWKAEHCQLQGNLQAFLQAFLQALHHLVHHQLLGTIW